MNDLQGMNNKAAGENVRVHVLCCDPDDEIARIREQVSNTMTTEKFWRTQTITVQGRHTIFDLVDYATSLCFWLPLFPVANFRLLLRWQKK